MKSNNISLKAKELLTNYNITEPPIDVKKIAKNLNIKIIEDDLPEDDISGILYIKDDTPLILINKSHFETRKRFSIAHEIGHYLLHNPSGVHVDKKNYFRDDRSSDALYYKEIESNTFAAELLMPTEFITQYLEENGINDLDEEIIELLAKVFNVSTIAMTFRLQNIGYLL